MPTLNRDGVNLYYEEAGAGGTPLLLVHGFAGNHSHLAPVFDRFKGFRRVVSVDRRGHGRSDKPVQEYTIETFADDLAFICRETGLLKPVVVIHSQDNIAFDLAARYPGLISGIVLLDTPTFPPEEVTAAFEQVAEALAGPAYLDVLRGFAGSAFAPTDDPVRREGIIESMCEVPGRVLASSLSEYVRFDTVAALTRCDVPILHISGWFPTDTRQLKSMCPGVHLAVCYGSGHFIQLEVPEQVNGMIDRFLNVVAVPQPVAA